MGAVTDLLTRRHATLAKIVLPLSELPLITQIASGECAAERWLCYFADCILMSAQLMLLDWP